jgi:hypothetical protein
LRRRSSWHNLPHKKQARRSEFFFFKLKKSMKNKDDDNQGGGGLEWGRSNKKAKRSEPFVLFCYGLVSFLCLWRIWCCRRRRRRRWRWVIFYFFPVIYLLFWGDITRRPAIAQLPNYYFLKFRCHIWILDRCNNNKWIASFMKVRAVQKT